MSPDYLDDAFILASSGDCIKDESNKASQTLGHSSGDQSFLSPAIGRLVKQISGF
jgi:hypothetical protein